MIHRTVPRPRLVLDDLVDRRSSDRRASETRYLTAARVAGRSFAAPVHVLVLMVAAGADVAAFYDVLANHTNLPVHMLYLLVAGFTAITLSLAHSIGAGYRDRVDGAPDHRAALLWFAAGGWLVLGAAAFAIRLVLTGPAPAANSTFGAAPSTVDSNEGLAMALLFAALYVGTGIAAALGAFVLHNSIGRAVVAASRRIRGLRRTLSRHERRHERLEAELRRLEAERFRVDQAHEAARLGRIAMGDELKQYVRMRIAQVLNDASATDAMFEPDRYPFRSSPLREDDAT
ncbi:hypothetical protein [Virgisporangium aurantiacum]|uniref:Uncharacterized protein n=1 Tax=Virgisporangium aurantiacum TaxID=175570 RepID=A0A8J3ZCC4_9ACTN|nr:hypothetical protein [Virgisporangium aurantiacum]GIJ59085.1 hypothetical protein Vau01_066010 [Virgisporangium aurantiacum]